MELELSPFEKRLGHVPTFAAAAYIHGRGVHLGGGPGGLFPRRSFARNKFCVVADPRGGPEVNIASEDISLLAPGEWDWVCIEDPFITPHNVTKACKLLKHGGHLILVGSELIPVEYKKASLIAKHISAEIKHEDTSYQIGIYRYSRDGKKGVAPWKKPEGKRACVCRFGALGDQITMTPLIRALYEDGYRVTTLVSADNAVVLQNNPYIDNVLIQERDFVFNPELKNYWAYWKNEYDVYINLSESVEGSILKTEGRRDYYTSKEERQTDQNYYQRTLALGGYPDADPTPELFFTKKEEKEMLKWLETARDGGPFIVWSVRGSSHHKVYPMMWPVMEEWLANNPEGKFALVGGPDAAKWVGTAPLPDRVLSLVGKTTVRESFLLTKYADLVIGPETGVMNAASCFETPKVLLLSHSSGDALARYWKNTIALAPHTECHPCFQMHYSLESCPLIELFDDNDNGGLVLPKCTIGIEPDEVLAAINSQLGEHYHG